MADPDGQHQQSVTADILSRPQAFDFFHALRSVENEFRSHPQIGRSRTLREEGAVRFGQFLSLSFATAAMEQAQGRHPEPNKLAIRFTGLTGPHGPLPLRMTEFIRNRLYGIYDMDLRGTKADAANPFGSAVPRDGALAGFLDIFHHRSISLFYRAWAVAQKTVDFDRVCQPPAEPSPTGGATAGSGRADEPCFSRWIASLFGCGESVFEGSDAISTWRKLPFAGFLSSPQRHASGLAAVLTSFFCAPAGVEELAGHWLEIPPEQCCRLGENRATGQLGTNCLVGSKVWDRQLKFSVRLGPLSFARFQTFLPGSQGHRELHDWIAFYTRREFFWEAAIVLKKEDVPAIQLGAAGRLGHTAWLTSAPRMDDAGDYKLRGGGLSDADNL